MTGSRTFDISLRTRPGLPEWPGDTPYDCRWTWQMAQGASVNVSAVTMSPHVGTHADAPLHVLPGGRAIDELPLPLFCGPARVLTLDGTPRDIDVDEILERVPKGTSRLLMRTRCSVAAGAFPDDWPALTAEAARALALRGLLLLGVDAPSVDRRESKTLEVHRAVFSAGGAVLENLDLDAVEDGEYDLTAYPIRLGGLDAAPVRAVLRRAE